LAFLNRILGGDVELISFVQRLLGYGLTGEIRDHALAIFYGDGANGKSQLIAAVMSVMAGHAAPAPDGLLVQRRSGPHEERIAMLRGRRLVVSSELEDHSVIAEALVKLLTGGDRLTARHMYGHRFEFEPSHTLLLVTNHLPRVNGTDTGIWRRLKVVPFEVVIPLADQIPDYGRQLADQDGPAILTWLVQGAADWYRTGLNEPESVRQATLNYRVQEDVFGQFLEEQTVGISGRTPVKDLLAAWRTWSGSKSIPVGRTQQFSRQLEEHGIFIESSQHAKFARGIGLSEAPRKGREVS
jgi:putative DNA primase/helicase